MAVQLFVRSDYSILESAVLIPDLVQRVHQYGYEAVGLADHNTTGGHVELAQACQTWGITPLFGLELDVAYPGGAVSRLVFFAMGQDGYAHLQRLCSVTPPVDFSELPAYAQRLVMCSGGTRGQLYALAAHGRWQEVKKLAQQYDRVFGSRWFVQLEWETPAEFKVMQALVGVLGEERCVAGQNICYLDPGDRAVLQVLAASRHGESGDHEPIPARAFMSRQEFGETFSKFPQALANTRRILELCQFELPRQQGLPRLPEDIRLEDAVWQGASQRYGVLNDEVRSRIAHELAVIQEMGLADYFLIVADIVRFAREQDIPVGPGRGSAASSVVAYCLGITSVDPLAYGLVFERFLNRARRNLPDIDLDFCYVRRGEVLEYVQQRFGREHVALIGTYGTFGEKNAERAVKDAFGRTRLERKERALVEKIARLKRHFSTHASGVVISAQPITCYQAVRTDRALPVTHGDMHALEWQGLLKIDLLGLRTLTFQKQTEAAVRKTHPEFDLENIPLTDEKTFALLSQGYSVGIFQLESELFQDLLRRIQPRTFSELAVLLALGRPGPLSLFPEYLENRAAPHTVKYAHPVLQEVLGETYGLAVFQEQVIELGHRLGGMSKSEADLLRIAISKKDGELINKLAPVFIRGCEENGLPAKEARELFAAIRKFAGYAFNKAHSVCYALISWRSAYLKAHYPQEFFACLMEGHLGDALKVYLSECRRMGIPIYGPDVHLSEVFHRREGEGIRLGLTALKHVGEAAAKQVVEGRKVGPYRSLRDFLRRVQLPDLTVQALVKGGALDALGDRRAHYAELGILPDDGLSRLRAERDLLGMYASRHPVEAFAAFLRQISGGLAFAAGEISKLRESGGMVTGQMDCPEGIVEFVLPLSMQKGWFRLGALAAVFGAFQGQVLRGEMVFPISPTVILVPKAGALELLQQVLRRHKGNFPVVLRLGRELLHILPDEYWVEWGPSLQDELQGCCAAVQLFDPW